MNKKIDSRYRDFRFWLILVGITVASIAINLQIRDYRTPENLNAALQKFGPLQLFVLIYLISTLAAALLFGPSAVIAVVSATAIFFLPAGRHLIAATYGEVILLRLGVITLVAFGIGFIIKREKSVRRRLLTLNRQLNETIVEKERYIKLAREAQEQERLRISRDLHDDSLQLLAAAIMDIDQAIESESAEKVRENVLRAKSTLQLTTETIRRYCEELRPLLLESMGLVPAVKYLSNELKTRAQISVDFEMEGEERQLDPEDEIHLFRLMQEAFHNIERHSRATSVEVLWQFNPDNLVIAVTDNGVGMWNFEPSSDRSLGIQGMHERIELLGGTISFESRLGYGTRILLTVPTELPTKV